MADLFEDKAAEWDSRPIPVQISQGVFSALEVNVDFHDDMTVLDFGAGTGLVCSKVAPLVKRVLAVDISAAMLSKLCEKEELADKVETHCQNILDTPLEEKVELVVSAMAMHHVEDTKALLRTLYDHLTDAGSIAIADLDAEDGDFHPPEAEGVYHHGFDRESLAALIEEAGFESPTFVTACEVHREDKAYPIFLVTAKKRS